MFYGYASVLFLMFYTFLMYNFGSVSLTAKISTRFTVN